jgi:hypothetical protein
MKGLFGLGRAFRDESVITPADAWEVLRTDDAPSEE